MLRIGSRFLAVAAVLLALAGVAASTALAAEGERVLDPRLSLIGGCQHEELDEIEDPGCPDKHPPAPFAFPRAVATDPIGDIYVASRGKKIDGSEGRIDIFGADGVYISEIPPGEVVAPQSLAVDSEGNLYVWAEESGELLLFKPCSPYEPAAGQIDYCEPPETVTLVGPECSCGRGGSKGYTQMAIDPDNDHLYVNFGGEVVEYESAAEGNEEVRTTSIVSPLTGYGGGLALDSARNRIYAQEKDQIGIYAVVEGQPAHEALEKIGTISGTTVPQGQFGGFLSIAVEEGTGHLFVYDTEFTHLWELAEDGTYLSTVEFPFETVIGTEIAVDNGLSSPNGKLSEEEGNGRYLYVPSHPKKNPGHLFAFFVSNTAPPEVKSVEVANVSESEAELQARIDPNNLATAYVFQLKEEGAANWATVGQGTLAAGNLDRDVSAAVSGLSPGTHYSFRIIATNEEGSDEEAGSFATYPSLPVQGSSCSNALLRTGLSALLPDCRAYELVTPPDTNARAPLGANGEGGGDTTRQVSPAGDKVPFRVEGGSLPGFGGTGSLVGDPYLATRTATGWSTAYTGPSGAEAVGSAPGTTSPDQGYSFWGAAGQGSAVIEGKDTFYVRYPDGHSELLGQGSLGIEPEATGRLISENGGHIIFTTGTRVSTSTAVQLEPAAAPDGTSAIYDRTPDGVLHVVSLKPGDVSFKAGEQAGAGYQGVSLDGIGVAFEVNGSLYLRYNDEKTFEIGSGLDFAGVAEGGARIFYLEAGNLKAFDVATQETKLFADTPAAVVPVTISADGSTAYFVSKSVVSGSGANPLGAKPQAGAENLYRSREGQISFIATVTERDVTGTSAPIGDGLGLWMSAIEAPSVGRLGWVPARSTPDGNVFLFKSRAQLTSYDPEGHAEIYRYDPAANRLQCLSCNPTGAAAQSDATLQSESREGSELATALVWPENLRADGRRAFFESSEPLVAGDGDGRQDIYEWEDQGVGSCDRAGGCLYLISSPQSSRNTYLWAVSRSGDDVFFLSSDLLVGADADETPSIYDARVNGGFAEPAGGECEGEGCRPNLSPPPPLSNGETPVRGSGDNVKPHHCAKGKRKVKRGGKVRCVKKKRHRKHHHHRASAGQKGGRR